MRSLGEFILRGHHCTIGNWHTIDPFGLGMSDIDTVFVLGAGASCEIGEQFPIGEGLKTKIGSVLRTTLAEIPDPGFDPPGKYGHVALAYGKINRSVSGLREATTQILNSIHDHGSIDDLLFEWKERPDMQLVAKLAIGQVILEAERLCPLNLLDHYNIQRNHQIFDQLSNTWLGGLTRSYRKTNINRRSLHHAFQSAAFIDFNYDRTLEKFLFYAFLTRCELQVSEAEQALNKIQIIHPYGHFGTLSFASSPRDGFGVMDLAKAAAGIRTYNETVMPVIKNDIHALFKSAKNIFFLGFGFHSSNLDLLVENRATIRGQIIATGYKLSGRRQTRAHELINRSESPGSVVVNETAGELVKQYEDLLEDLT